MRNVFARAAITTFVLLLLGSPRTGVAQDEPKVLEGEAAFNHASTRVVLKAAVHFRAGKTDAGMALHTASEQADWTKSTEKAELAASLKENGCIVVEDDVRASLVVVCVTQSSPEPGIVSSTSSTLSLGFELEDGEWRLAN